MRRYRANRRKREIVEQAVDHSLGLAPPPIGKLPSADLAQMLRDRYVSVVNGMTDEDLLNKDFASSLSVGLKAQGLIDGRERQKAQQGTAELAFSIIAMVTGRSPLPELTPGTVLDGDYEEVEASGEAV